MKTLQVELPESLARQVAELADQEQVTVDQLVSIALAYQVSAWRNRDTKIRPGDGKSAGCCAPSRRRKGVSR